jgi:hypothetical protein
MSGGLFGTQFSLNPKCLVFSLMIVLVYFLPHPLSTMHTIVMIFLLGMAAYIGLAWYDFLFDCDDHLKPTFLGYLSAPFKPPAYGKQLDELPAKEKKTIRIVDMAVLSLVVFAFVYPFLVGHKKTK